jgi:hypothetical protein
MNVLQDLREVPYSQIEGAYVKVDVYASDRLMQESDIHVTKTREGEIIGRGHGRGVSYDTGEKDCVEITIGPSIYLHTQEDTILEIRLDKSENELLAFELER